MSRRTENAKIREGIGKLGENGIGTNEAILGILVDISMSLADIADSLRKMNKI